MIKVSNIQFHYRNNGFQLSIHKLSIAPGEKVALIGPSGTGKTTLLNLLAGILVPSSGVIEIDGLNIVGLPIEDRQDFRAVKMGLVFQEFGLLEYLTVLENICLSYRISPVLELDATVLKRAREIAETIGLGDKLHRYPKHLSQGEQQRIEVCRALVTRPAMILGDEPTGNLDPHNRDHVAGLLFDYSAESGAPLLVVTHDYELVKQFDRMIDMQDFGEKER
ncbi:MAG: ABC transporter ATP-binding protein [Planctomycetes bacterium]|nr:ABC transporter ATP-binding protein [Planctomycetota bacterium]